VARLGGRYSGADATGRGLAILFLVLATLFWAVNYVVGAAALAEFSPIELTAARWVLAAPVLLLLAAIIERPDWRRVARALPRLALLGVVGVAGYNLLLYSALQFISPSGAALVNAANPGLILLGGALLARARLRRATVAGLLLGSVGVLIVLIAGGDHPLALTAGPGEGLMLLAIVAWTVYSLAGRWVADIPPITATAVQAAVIAVLCSPIALAMPGPAHDGITEAGILALLVVAALPSVGSYLLWNSALRVIPAGEAGLFLNLITVFVVVIGLFVGSVPSPADLLGGAMILAGVFIGQRSALRSAGRSPSRSPVSPVDSEGSGARDEPGRRIDSD
jgi:drug/metabolite transporter (DMT)-like permease